MQYGAAPETDAGNDGWCQAVHHTDALCDASAIALPCCDAGVCCLARVFLVVIAPAKLLPATATTSNRERAPERATEKSTKGQQS